VHAFGGGSVDHDVVGTFAEQNDLVGLSILNHYRVPLPVTIELHKAQHLEHLNRRILIFRMPNVHRRDALPQIRQLKPTTHRHMNEGDFVGALSVVDRAFLGLFDNSFVTEGHAFEKIM
jgi:hypothetical protein